MEGPAHVVEKRCPRCKERKATLEIRSEPACETCFCAYVRLKTVKRFEALDRESKATGRGGTANYLLGLSSGPSSAAMVHIFHELDEGFAKKRRPVQRKFHVVYVDTDDVLDRLGLGESIASPADASPRASLLLDGWRARYPRLTFERVPLAEVVGMSSIDWSALPTLSPGCTPDEQLRLLLEGLPSLSSRADVTRLLVRHVLVSRAVGGDFRALLLGHNTTTLAALTLAETAKGRGFSLPWFTSDGMQPVFDFPPDGQGPASCEAANLTVHYPLRELYCKELVTFAELAAIDKDLMSTDQAAARSVVSHRDLSIDNVMTRYFHEVEQSYPSIVANVVRTTGKLGREHSGLPCGLCGVVNTDRVSDRWGGEKDDARVGDARPRRLCYGLCYGCERSVYG